jgi:NitT/TauT family transport system substrate-binding protein
MKLYFIFFISLGCLLSSVQAQKQDSSLQYTIALNWKAEPQFGGFYSAQIKNKSLILQEGGSGTPTLQMVLSGKVDFAIVSGDELVLAHSRGQKDLIALFAVYQKNPVAIMVHADHPAKNLAELMVSSGTLLWQEGLPYAQYLKKKFKTQNLKTAPYSGGIGLFLNDPSMAQQCFVTAEPLLAEKNGKKVRTFLVADEGFNPYTTVLVTRKSYYVTNKEEVEALVKIVREGWQDYLTDPKAANNIMHKLNPSMELSLMQASSQAQKSLIQTKKIGEMSLPRWQELVEQMFDLKIIKAKPVASDLFVDIT